MRLIFTTQLRNTLGDFKHIKRKKLTRFYTVYVDWDLRFAAKRRVIVAVSDCSNVVSTSL